MRAGIVKLVADNKHKIKKILPMRLLRIVKKKYLDALIKKYNAEPISKDKLKKMEFGINLVGDIRAEIGLGQSLRLIANELEESKYSFGIYDFQLGGNLRRGDLSWEHRIRTDYPYCINLFHINPQEVGLAYLYLDKDIWNNRYNIAFWLWELEEFPKEYVQTLKFFDEIWTPSEFSSNSIRKVTNKPVYTIPYYVLADAKSDIYNRAYFGLPEHLFLYLVMYDTNSTMERKNPIGALNAYRKAFGTYNEKVGLVIKINNATEKELQEIRAQVGGELNVYFITQTLDKMQVNSLISAVDVFVSLHRAEGFGLVMAEAMLLRTVCIATEWSSNTEFMSNETACMVPYNKVLIQKTTGNYKKGCVWAEADEDEAAVYMQRLYQDKQYYEKKADAAERSISKILGKTRIVEMLETRIGEIEDLLCGGE